MDVECFYGMEPHNIYTCKVTRINIKHPNRTISSFVGNHYDRKTDENVKWLLIQRNSRDDRSARGSFNVNVEYLPVNLQQRFPNLKRLTIHSCGLKNITRNDLKGLENLEFISLSSNRLTLLPDDLFADMKNLKTVHFDNNKIQFLSSKLLKPIEHSLDAAIFYGNGKLNANFVKSGKINLQQFKDIIDRKCTPPAPEVPAAEEMDKLAENLESSTVSTDA